MWPFLTILAVAGLGALHFWWSRKFIRSQEEARTKIEAIQQSHRQTHVQAETQQEALFNSMVEGLLLLDASGKVQLANRAFVSLFDLAVDVRGKTVLEALRISELAEVIERIGIEGQLLGHELRLPGPGERWLQINGAAIMNGGGQRTATLLVFHDLTRLKKLERTREEFVANVSHELRTPLSLIKGYAETLLEGAKDNPEVAGKFLRTIDRNAERLRLLIDDLLTISELESGRVKLNLQPVLLRPLVDRVFDDLKANATAKKISLANRIPELTGLADADRLEQVFGNLIDNAIKYGRPEGTVTAGAHGLGEGQVIECFVQDDGHGIPKEALERIFERFYRVDKARSREQGGTGLGLSIVKHLIQNHGGKVLGNQ